MHVHNRRRASIPGTPHAGAGTHFSHLGAEIVFLDTRPVQRRDWLLIGCERSLQFHRHFYGDEPRQVDICPRCRAADSEGELLLTKCCLIERGIEVNGSTAVVPWGFRLDEIRQALRLLTEVDTPIEAHTT